MRRCCEGYFRPRRASAFFHPSGGACERFRRSCGLDAGGEGCPHPGTGVFALRGRAPFLPPPGGGENCCRAAARACKKGYRTPLKTGFPIPPLATPPDLPVCRSAEPSRLKNEESTDFTSVLSFFFCPGSAIARFAAHISARPVCTGRKMGGVEYFDVKSLLSGFLDCSRRAGCPHPAG